jgi:hypothetical protein
MDKSPYVDVAGVVAEVASWGDSKLAAHSLGAYIIHAAVPADSGAR